MFQKWAAKKLLKLTCPNGFGGGVGALYDKTCNPYGHI